MSSLAVTPQRILIIRLRFIGDVVLTTPLIHALHRQFPGAELTYLTEPAPAALLFRHPALKDILVLDRERIGALPLVAQWREHIRFFRMLRMRRFDLVIDLFGNPRSALLTWATGARCRVGFDVRGRGAAYTVKIRRTGSIRAVDAYLDALRTLGYPAADTRTRLPVHEEDAVWATDWLLDRGLAHHWPLIGLNPGASWPAKRWGTAHFAGLGDRLIRERQARILLIQGPGQEQYIQDVCAAMRTQPVVVDLLPLPRLAALIQRCHVFVSNDCGPMHIAAAVGTRTVGLFGPSRPDIWFPYPAEDGHTALSPPTTDCCGQDVCTRAEPCITGISIDRVMEAIDRALYVIGDSRKNG